MATDFAAWSRRAAALGAVAAALTLTMSAAAAAQEAGGRPEAFLKAVGKAFVLEHARIVDGAGGPVRDNATVVIENGRIVSVGSSATAVPAGARHIDLSGHTILPGLVMMHEHLNYFSGAFVWDAQPGSVPKLLLAAGVTTARTAGSEAPQVDLNLKRRIDAGRAVGPRLFVTGAYLNGENGGFLGDTVVASAADGREVTAYWGDRGATSMKVYSKVSLEALQGAVSEANRRGMHVAAHLGELSCARAAEAGVHTIEHGLTSCVRDLGVEPDQIGSFRYDSAAARAAALIAKLVAAKVTLVSTPPTTALYEASEEELAMLSPDQKARYLQLRGDPPGWMPSPEARASWDAAHRAFERHFVGAGGRLLVGADANDFGLVPGFANHAAMIALVRGGFSPLQVIRFSTHDAATFLGLDGQVGRVAPGYAADLLIVQGRPDQEIEDIRNVAYVFKDGQAYDPAKLRRAAQGALGQH